ncbi:MAG: serine hydrolase [Candidatus Aminicenantes bacterium]|nr:serine hydrolase [Candidatus Aminicenantes bacterium]
MSLKENKRPIFFFLICLFLSFFLSRCETAGSLTRKRIKAVERGLLNAVVFKGETPERMKLSERMQFYRIPGVSVAVIDKYALEWAKGYGVERIGTGVPVTPDSLFQAASLSQSVTAVGVLRLVEMKMIDLDGAVNAQLRSWKLPLSSAAKEENVSPRLLLCHSAGLASLRISGYPPEKPLPTLSDILRGRKPSDSPGVYVYDETGTKMQYSELGYAVLQQLIEDVTKKPFFEIIEETVLNPLRMTQSTYAVPLPDIFRAKAVAGHDRQGNPLEGGWLHYPVAAASGLWSTPSDLARFAVDVMKTGLGQSRTIVSSESVRLMLTPQLSSEGLGFEVKEKGENLYFSQRGGNEGFQCCLVAYPSLGKGAVIMANSDNGAYLIDEILRSISDAYTWPHFIPTIKTYYRLDPSIYDQYVGSYEVNPDYRLEVSHEDYYLIIQPTDQAPTKFFVESPTRFFSVDPYTEIRFLKDDTGKVTSLQLTQRGQTSKADKID